MINIYLHISVNTVDIGLAQLAMHSAYETAGVKDTTYMIEALTGVFLRSTISLCMSGWFSFPDKVYSFRPSLMRQKRNLTKIKKKDLLQSQC